MNIRTIIQKAFLQTGKIHPVLGFQKFSGSNIADISIRGIRVSEDSSSPVLPYHKHLFLYTHDIHKDAPNYPRADAQPSGNGSFISTSCQVVFLPFCLDHKCMYGSNLLHHPRNCMCQ